MMMKPGDWVAIDGYDSDDASMAVVVATSRHDVRLDEEAAATIAQQHDHEPVRTVTWRGWVEAILCREVIE